VLKLFTILIFLTSLGSLEHTTSNESLYDIKIEGIDGNTIDLNQYRGKKILFVNVASKCWFTYQYDQLQELYTTYKEKLVIIGLPCDQFRNQEFGSAL